MSSEAKAPPPAPAAAERGRRNSLENILVEDAQVLMSFLQTPGEEDDDTEIEELLKAEKAAQAAAEERRKKLEAVKARQQAKSDAMEKRVSNKIKGISTDDVSGLKRALAKALLVIDDLRAAKESASAQEQELEELRGFKQSIEDLCNQKVE
eukprot:g1593.t1